jgi:hypothetical protein
MPLSPKQWAIAALFSRWRRPCPFEEGYTLLLPSPMDMPFLLRFALEGLAQIDTTNCRQILVVPDGRLGGSVEGLERVVEAFPDPRVELVRLRPIDVRLFRMMKPPGGAGTHWMMVQMGVTHARCGHAFLHDADAFFIETDGLERQFAECRDGRYHALGVTARWDPFFEEVGYKIPGTWELMFSTRWARSRSPYALKNGWGSTERGRHEFDSMLYPMYLDYPSGRVGVMGSPPRLVHYNGTIFSFRSFAAGTGRVDEFFRLLLLAVLEDLIPSADGRRVLPTVAELERGLTDPSAPVSYDSDLATVQYPIFRALLDEMCDSPVFCGPRAEQIRELVRPFDEHYKDRKPVEVEAAGRPRLRAHGMG